MNAGKRPKARRTKPRAALAADSGSTMTPRRDLLLILGMHRSGTSALTGVLEKLAVALGDELLPPTHDNPKGYFENVRVVAAQETLFAALHRAWHDPRPLPDGWKESVAADETREALVPLVRDMFANAAVAAVKDPRSSRVVPLWLDVAAHVEARPSALLMIRHPNEVAGSLHKRDGLSRPRAHLLWMTYLLEAERATRELPRAFVSYEALLADWRIELDRMRKRLGVALPATTAVAEEIDGFLDVSLRNNQAERDEQPVSPFEPMALELYGLALHCAADPAGKRADEEFDAIARKLGRLAARYLDAPLRLEDELQRQAMEKSRVDMSLQLAALRELWRPAFPSRPPGACRLYYREASASFVESRSASADPVLQEDGRRVVFELPAGTRFDHLRMDPDDAAGVFAIQSLAIGGKAVDDLVQRVSAVSEFALPVTSVRDGIRFAALGEDPYFELNAIGLGHGEANKPLQVEMHFRVETVLSEIVEYLRDSGKKLEHGQQDLGERQRHLIECVRQFEQDLSGFGESAADVSAKLGELLEQHLTGFDESTAGLSNSLKGLFEQQVSDFYKFSTDMSDNFKKLFAQHVSDYSKLSTNVSSRLDVLETATRELHLALDEESHLRRQDVAQMFELVLASRRAIIDSGDAVNARLEVDFHGVREMLRASQRQHEMLTAELVSVRAQQETLLSWARRRSPGYWWRRMRGLH